MTPEPCSCSAAGWCPRHSQHKNHSQWMACRGSDGLREYLDEQREPNLRMCEKFLCEMGIDNLISADAVLGEFGAPAGCCKAVRMWKQLVLQKVDALHRNG